MGGPKGHMRGNKTHRLDQKINGTTDPVPDATMQTAHRKPERSKSEKHRQMQEDESRRRHQPDRTDERDR